MITLKEIAEICHVSTATVSNVINGKSKTSEETAARIRAVIEETGYRTNVVARGLRTRRTNMIALIVEDVAQFTSPTLISGIMAQCEERGFAVVLYNLRLYDRWSDTWYDQEKKYHSVLDPVLQSILSSGADGVIYLAGHARVIRCFPDSFPLPAVMSYAFSDSVRVPSVVIDDEAGAREVVDYLISMGHRRIGFVAGREDNLHSRQRLAGYQQSLLKAGILYDPGLVYYGHWTRESGYAGAEALEGKEITAYFAISDRMAGGVCDYLEKKGRQVGRDVSVAGFDDESIAAYFRPPLTTTALPLHEIGRVSAELLLDRIQDPEGGKYFPTEPEIVRVPCSFIERSSVCRL
ncbi:MAG: LacI family transcriptional regulator [Lachnospiraceae bacterium]|nr:LacI family transcriptional regulator [Lachnospiraceae bacterium]